MSRPPQHLSLSHLLASGFGQSASLAPATLSLAAARAVGSAALMLVPWGLLESFIAGQAPVGIGIASGLLVLWLTAELVEGVVLAGALRQGRQRLLGLEVPPLLPAILREARRGLTFPLWLGALQLGRTIWRWGALLGGLTLYFRAFEGRGSGLVASIGLSLAIVLPLLLGLLVLVWLRVGLVQAVHDEQSVSIGLFEAVGLLRGSLGLPLLLIFLFGLFSFMGEGVVTAVVTPTSTLREISPLLVLRLTTLSSLMALVVASIPVMLFEHAGWQALMAWRLGREGALPPERLPAPRPAPIVQAGPALAGAGAGGGVIDASPASPGAGPGPVPRSEAGPSPAPEAIVQAEAIVEALPVDPSAAGAEPIVQATPLGQASPVSPSEDPVSPGAGPRADEASSVEGGADPSGAATSGEGPEEVERRQPPAPSPQQADPAEPTDPQEAGAPDAPKNSSD